MINVLDDSQLTEGLFSPVCSLCIHEKDEHRRCSAFKGKPIPLKIWSGSIRHTSPFPGDNGIQFESARK